MGKDILQPPEFVSNPRGEQANRRLNTSLSIAVVAALLSDCGGTGTVPIGPSPDNTQTTTTTEPTSIPSAEIAPTQTPENEIVVNQSYMTQEQILAIDPLISNLFGEFQNQIKTTKPDATFSAWGDLSRTSTGEQYFTPFFETFENGELTQEYVVRAKSDGSALVTLRLQQAVVTASDGQEYYTLSQVTNADTLEAITPIPLIYIGVPKAQFDGLSSEQQGIVDVYFNAFGGILPKNSPDAGNFVGFPDGALKVRAALMPLAPIPATPEPTSTPEVTKYDFSSSVNPDKIPILEKWYVGQPFHEAAVPGAYAYAKCFTTSYKLINEGHGASLYVEFLYEKSFARVKIDEAYYMVDNINYIKFAINSLTPAEAASLSNYLNESISNINNFSGSQISEFDSYLGLFPHEAIDKNYNVQELLDMFNNSLVPVSDSQIENFTDPNNIDSLLSSEDGGFVLVIDIWPRQYNH